MFVRKKTFLEKKTTKIDFSVILKNVNLLCQTSQESQFSQHSIHLGTSYMKIAIVLFIKYMYNRELHAQIDIKQTLQVLILIYL